MSSMSNALIDDQLLGKVLRGQTPKFLDSKSLHTTGYWYVRLCQAVLGAQDRLGTLSGPFAELPEALRRSAMSAVLELPSEIGLVSLRELGPVIAQLRGDHQLNILNIEVLAAATHLNADVFLSAPSPMLESALTQRKLKVKVTRRKSV
jgi:hypothetical protein